MPTQIIQHVVPMIVTNSCTIWVGKDSSKFQTLMPIITTTTVIGSYRSSSFLVVVGTKPRYQVLLVSLRTPSEEQKLKCTSCVSEVEDRSLGFHCLNPSTHSLLPALRRLHHELQHSDALVRVPTSSTRRGNLSHFLTKTRLHPPR